MNIGGPEMAPQTPQPSERPGEAVPLLSTALLQHGLRDPRELRRHLGVCLHRLGPYDHAGGAGVEVAPDEIAIRRLTKDRDGQLGGVTPGVFAPPVAPYTAPPGTARHG